MSGKAVRRALVAIVIVEVAMITLGLAVDWFGPTVPSEEPLFKALAGVDRIRVRSGGTSRRDPAKERTYFEVVDRTEIEKVIRAIRIDAAKSGYHCSCCGEPSFEFYRGQKLVLTLGYHHGRSLRWIEGWTSDGVLTAESAASLNDWLRRRGIKLDQRSTG